MRFSPVKKIMEAFRCDRDTAVLVRKIVKDQIDPISFPQTERWVGQCYNMPSKTELKMSALNEVLDMHGVEALYSKTQCCTSAPWYKYLNAGDPYVATIIRNNRNNTYYIGCWGDIVERHPGSFE